jgi:hypothetical protein
LSRLLDLRGQDTAPSPEQLAATRPVTMSSSVGDKLALYADLFRARTDVYAVRWENNRTGASGWMPAVVLTRRVAHLDVLAARLAQRGHEALVLQGGLSVTERRATVGRVADATAGDGVLVLGTTPFIGEGFDAPALDTLFLAGPVSFDGLLIQCAGRVVRAAPGKDVAEVHDYHDRAVPIIAASLPRRMPGYRALGFVQTGPSR